MVTTALLLAAAVALLVALAEMLHARRVARVARLAFGPRGKPAFWVPAAPVVRCIAAAAATWGAAVLFAYDPVEVETEPAAKASKQLLICLDVSPSMQLQDAGPEAEKLSRARWAGKLVQAILDRLDMKSTRISVVGFYTKALPVLRETYDKNVVSNMLDGLPLHVAFEPGATDLNSGIRMCMEMARPWARKSAMLLVISDGDAEHTPASVPRPDSISDVIVIGVGDPDRGMIVGGHNSRQDAASLRQLAARLGGVYHQGNTKHLPSEILDGLSMISPRNAKDLGLREAALIALGAGAAGLGLVGPALVLLGRRGEFAASRRIVSRRAAARPQPAQT